MDSSEKYTTVSSSIFIIFIAESAIIDKGMDEWEKG